MTEGRPICYDPANKHHLSRLACVANEDVLEQWIARPVIRVSYKYREAEIEIIAAFLVCCLGPPLDSINPDAAVWNCRALCIVNEKPFFSLFLLLCRVTREVSDEKGLCYFLKETMLS